MSSMFGRRRGSSAQPPVDRDTHAAAAAAAVLATSHAQASLSSAAAAAALRSRTTTPEPVGNLVTKRMVRRGSVSSVGSGSVIGSGTRGGVARGGLQRTNSGGSMTERTFRSPSPGGSGRGNGAVSPAPDAPPVPALPKDIKTRAHNRSSSLEPPQRVMSPARGRGGRGASVDRAGLMTPSTARQDKRLSNVAERDELERQNSNNNVNFSRPISSQQNSLVTPSSAASASGAKKYTHGTGSWFSKPSGSGDVAAARPRTSDGFAGRKKKPAPIAPRDDLPNSVFYESEDSVMIYDPHTRTFTAKPREKPKKPVPPSPTLPAAAPLKPGTYDPNTRSIVPALPEPVRTDPNDSTPKKKQRPSVPPVETKLEPPPRNPARLSPTSSNPSSPRATGFLHKQPSVVREDPEGEDEAAISSPITANLKPTGRTVQTSAGPAKSYVASSRPHQRSASLDIPRQDDTGRGRNESISPARSAHFSASPVIEAIRHDPPPRSISPVKSALKHHQSPASSVRTASSMVTFSPTGPRAPPSEVSDVTSNASEDGFAEPKEKKRVRVSFDEQPQEIDAAGVVSAPKAISTAGGSPLAARDRSPTADGDLDSELMKPQPALPSFGSVRRNRAVSPEMPEKVTEMPPAREGSSSDHAIAGILANANVQEKKDAETPLPPEVTSKDTTGYTSDESEEESSFRPDASSTPANAGAAQPLQARKLSVDELELAPKTRDFATENAQHLAASAGQDADVPAINLQPPTPGDEVGKELGQEELPETSPKPKSSFEAFSVPGSWAEESSDDRNVAAPPSMPQPVSTKDRIQSILAQPVVEQSAPAEPQPSVSEPVSAPIRQAAPTLDVLDEESDDSAAFSDAAEDLSDLEDGGFGSLDAIVTSPMSPTTPKEPDVANTADAPESPTAQQAARKQALQEAQESGDWSKATAYWSQLSRQQKQQIEREHMSDDEEARPVAPAVVKKAKKKVVPGEAAVTPQHVSQQQQAMPRTLRGKADPAPAASDGDVHMRRSMRGNTGNNGPAPAVADGEVHMRRSMRSGPQQRPQSEYVPHQQRHNAPARPMSSGNPAPSRLGPNGLALPQGAANRARTDSESSLPMRPTQESAFPRVQPANRQPPPRMQQLSSTKPAQGSAPTMRAAPAGPSGAFTAKLQKQVTNDSDSESSFRKKRRASQSTVGSTGRYTMKRSMRAGSIDGPSVDQRSPSPTPAAKRGGGAFSIRSLSPSGGGVFGRSKGEKLRESLRSGSVDAGAGRRTTLRSQPPGPGLGPAVRGGRPATVGSAAPAVQKPRFRSRFADSDDEEEGPAKGSGFRSRFADSDDEDEGPTSPPLRPVRGIPRRAGQDDGDSTDLEDEEESETRRDSRARQKQAKPMVPAAADVEKAMEAARRKLGIPETTERGTLENHAGEALGKGSLRKPASEAPKAEEQVKPVNTRPELVPEKKKRSFMNSLLRRNRSSQVGVPQLPQGSPAPASPVVATPASPQVNGLPQASKAPDASIPSSPSTTKLVRRSSGQPQMKRGDSTLSNATTLPSSTALKRKDSDNWPLPPVPPIPSTAAAADGGARPSTSDGVNPEAIKLARTMRPDVGSRSQSQQLLAPASRRESANGRSVGFAPGSKEEDGEAGAEGIYSKRTGKKKKFGMLRRAFGLYD